MRGGEQQAFRSQGVVCLHPESVAQVKEELRERRGHLTFRDAQEVWDWQGVLFRGNKALGRLVAPSVSRTPVEEPAQAPHSQGPQPEGRSSGGGAAQRPTSPQLQLHEYSLTFSSWVPAAARSSSSGREQQPVPLAVALDEQFPKEELRVQVLGRQAGANFALPHSYRAGGRELAAAVQVQLQQREYVARHQRARGAAIPPQSTSVSVESGSGLERWTAMFDVGQRPGWLKGIVCRFLAAEASPPVVAGEAEAGCGSSMMHADPVAEAATCPPEEAAAGAGSKGSSEAAAQRAVGSVQPAPSSSSGGKKKRKAKCRNEELAGSSDAAGSAGAPADAAAAAAAVKSAPEAQLAQPLPSSRPAQQPEEQEGRSEGSMPAQQPVASSPGSPRLEQHSPQPCAAPQPAASQVGQTGSSSSCGVAQPPPCQAGAAEPAGQGLSPALEVLSIVGRNFGPTTGPATCKARDGSSLEQPHRQQQGPSAAPAAAAAVQPAVAQVEAAAAGAQPGTLASVDSCDDVDVVWAGSASHAPSRPGSPRSAHSRCSSSGGGSGEFAVPPNWPDGPCKWGMAYQFTETPLEWRSHSGVLVRQSPCLQPSPVHSPVEWALDPGGGSSMGDPGPLALAAPYSSNLPPTPLAALGYALGAASPFSCNQSLPYPMPSQHVAPWHHLNHRRTYSGGSGGPHRQQQQQGRWPARTQHPGSSDRYLQQRPRQQQPAHVAGGYARSGASYTPVHSRSNSGQLEARLPHWQQQQQMPAERQAPPRQDLTPSPAAAVAAAAVAAAAPSSQPASEPASPVVVMASLPDPPASAPMPSRLSKPVLELQVPETEEDAPDLERFLHAAAPVVALPPAGAQALTLADLWRWYEQPSLFGCEVATLGGRSGPSSAYFLPYLSALHLFTAAAEAGGGVGSGGQAEAAAGGSRAEAPLLSYPGGLDSWPRAMRPLVQWGEGAHMGERVPLAQRLGELCGGEGQRHPLMSTPLAQLHPYSWFAVAWYPLYRIPEAPLTARFLTFHTLAELWEVAHSAAAAAGAADPSAAAAPTAAAEPEGGSSDCSALGGSQGEREQLQPQQQQLEAAPAGEAAAAQPQRPSYKCMLTANMAAGAAAAGRASQAGQSSARTPTRVGSFPGSPAGSEAGTRATTHCASAPPSVDGGSSSRSGGALLPPGAPASSSQGGSMAGESSGTLSCMASPRSSAPASAACSEAGDAEEQPCTQQLPAGGGGAARDACVLPPHGLCWYCPNRVEDWADTLVAVQLPQGFAPRQGASLGSGARVVGNWRGFTVLARQYPLAKGGPLSWDIQRQEMGDCARLLASGTGLVPVGAAAAAQPAAASPQALCPDFEFFRSRAQRYA